MIIDSPIISGSHAASGSLNQHGNVVITGSLTVTGTINGSITGSITTASYALNAETLDGLDNTSFVTTSSFNTVSGSFSTRVTNLETASGSFSTRVTNNESTGSSLTTASGSFSTRTTNLETASGSFSARVTNIEATASNLTTDSGSFSTRITNTEATASSLVTASGSFSTRTTNLESASGSFSTRVTNAESSITSLNSRTGSYATTGSNIFVDTQYINAINNAISFTSTASLYTDGGLRITKDMYVSGTAYFNNVTVFGTQSISYVSSSQLNIGTNIISVNTDTPLIRFGGLAVYDSGSTGLSGSILWDSENNHWVYTNPSGSTYSGGMLISGPRASSLGTEQGTTACALMVGQGGDHITSSAIFHYGNATCFYGNSYITSSGGAYFPNNIGVGIENTTAKIEASKFQNHALRINYCTDQSVTAGDGCQGGIYAVNCGLNGYPLVVDEISTNAAGGQYPVLIRSLATGGTPAIGMATGIHFGVPDCASNINVAQMAFRTTDANPSTYTMRWEMRMKNLNTYQTNFMVLGDGSLALGTNGTAPSYRLDVSGCTRITGDACFGGNTLINGCVGIGTTCIMDTLTVGNNGGLVLQRFSGATTFSSDLYFFSTRGSQGTPTAKLNGDVAMGIRPRAYDGTSYLDVAAIESKLDGVTSTNVMYGNLIFSTNNGGTTLTERMRITSGGNVGIGAVSPASKFHICGSTNDIGVRMTNTTANKSYMAYSDTSCNYIIYDISKDSNRMTIFNDGQVSFACQVCVPQVISSGTITGTTLYGSTAICGGVICGTGLTVNNGNAHLNINFNTGTSAGWDVKTYFTGGNSGSEQFIYFGFPGGTTDAFIQRGSNSRLDLGTSSTARLSISATGIACFACELTAKSLGTNDLILNNLNYEHANYVDGTRGSWLIQEGACDLFIINQVSCKKYKFNLIEIE